MSQLLALSEPIISAGAGVKGSQAPCCSGILSRAAQGQERGVDDMGEEWEAGSQGLLWVGRASLRPGSPPLAGSPRGHRPQTNLPSAPPALAPSPGADTTRVLSNPLLGKWMRAGMCREERMW